MMVMLHREQYRKSNCTKVIDFYLYNFCSFAFHYLDSIRSDGLKCFVLNFVFFFVIETEYFSTERGCMIEMRAHALIESKCDKLALNFITEALRAIRMCTNDHSLRRTVSLLQHQRLLEMYFSLLYKFKESSRLKQELEEMEIESAKEFIVNSFATVDANEAKNPKLQSNSESFNAKKRSSSKQTSSSSSCVMRLHKYHVLVSQYALQLILVRVLSGEYGLGLDYIFTDLLTEWIRRNKSQANFDELFQKLINTAVSNAVIYDCCEVLYKLVSPLSKFIIFSLLFTKKFSISFQSTVSK